MIGRSEVDFEGGGWSVQGGPDAGEKDVGGRV